MTDTALPLPRLRLETKLRRKSALSKLELKIFIKQLRAILELGGFEFEREGTQTFKDQYFDTPRFHLLHTNACARIRHIGGLKYASIKKLKQQPALGVFECTEEAELLTKAEYQELLAEGRMPLTSRAFASMNERLQVVLVVQTRRRTVRLRRGTEQYRLVLDTFRYENVRGGRSSPLFELSLESISDHAFSGLETLRAKLLQILETNGFEPAPMLKYRNGVERLGLHLKRLDRTPRTCEPKQKNVDQTVNVIGIIVGVVSIAVGLLTLFLA